MKRILVVANDFPYPPTHGAAVDMWNRILVLKDMGYQVSLLATVKESPEQEYIEAVRKQVEDLWLVRRRMGFASIFSVYPFQVQSRSGLATVDLQQRFDAILLEADYVASFLRNPAARNTKIILRIHNEQVNYFRDLAQGATTWRKKLYFSSESFKFRFFSRKVIRKCDLLLFLSDSECREHVRRNAGDAEKSLFLPTNVSPADLRPFSSAGRSVLFIGTLTISHNLDSIAWYMENVHELLSDLPGYEFEAAGTSAECQIPELRNLIRTSKNAALHENPKNLDDLYARAAVFVNPVIRGAGVKIKVINAIQAGLPVVSTSMGIEGTGLCDSVHVLVGDTPRAFAECIRRILTELDLAATLVSNAQAFIRQRYDMKASMEKPLYELFERGGHAPFKERN